MKIIANKSNLKMHAARLLEKSVCSEQDLLRECLTGFTRTHGHISHDRAAHLERIDKIIGTYGVEGMLLDRHGDDVSGSCSMSDVSYDIQYCNAGDTYALTIMYGNGKLCIGDWGSVVENCMGMTY